MTECHTKSYTISRRPAPGWLRNVVAAMTKNVKRKRVVSTFVCLFLLWAYIMSMKEMAENNKQKCGHITYSPSPFLKPNIFHMLLFPSRLVDTDARNYRPCFRENQPKRSFSIKWKRAFWACFRENWVYKFRHRAQHATTIRFPSKI